MTNVSADFSKNALNRAKEGLYLIRGYQADDPYAVVTDLNPEESERISREAFPQRHEDYLEVRKNVDAWIKTEAKKSGVQIARKNSVCFALVNDIDSVLKNLGPKDNMLVLPFRDVDMTNWSFTIDDSFVGAPQKLKGSYDNLGHPEHPLHGKVLNSEELLKDIIKNGFLEGEVDGNPRYYEGQLWANAPILLNNSAAAQMYIKGLQL